MIEKGNTASLIGGFNFNSGNTNSSKNSSADTTNNTNTNSSGEKTTNSTTPKTINSPDVGAYTTKNAVSSQLIDTKTTPLDYITNSLAAVSNLPKTVDADIKSGGQAITNGISGASENISTATNNISNYFSGIANSVVNPGTPQNCPAN